MRNNFQAQNRLDKICINRITSSDFAQKQSLKIRLIRWVKGGAK